jgi:ATP phosphoribosyltransferase regulatory subunit
VISTHRERQIERASQALIAGGGGFVDLPTLLPSSLVLELAGESLRPRLFFATAPDGSELCLRPDLTIPAVVKYIATSEYDDDPFAWACKGQVFRAARGGEDRLPEFTQIGLERFGDKDIVETDVAIFLAAWSASNAGHELPLYTRFSDGGLLARVISQADLPDIWRCALLEQTNHSRAFLNILAMATGRSPVRALTPLENQLAMMPFPDACHKVSAAILDGKLTLVGDRSIEDITTRLLNRAKRALAPCLQPEIGVSLEALAMFKPTQTPFDSLNEITRLAKSMGVDLRAWHDEWRTRLTSIASQASDVLALCRFEALPDEAFDYYDGMAFDIAANANFTRPIATGGRYDRLVGEVSEGKRQARAIGCVIRPDRFSADANGEE